MLPLFIKLSILPLVVIVIPFPSFEVKVRLLVLVKVVIGVSIVILLREMELLFLISVLPASFVASILHSEFGGLQIVFSSMAFKIEIENKTAIKGSDKIPPPFC